MSDLELYIYIALAVIYFLTRVLKPKKTPRAPGNYKNTSPGSPESQPRNRTERPLTFEELLQEFTGKRETQRIPQPPETETVMEEVIAEPPILAEEMDEKEEYGYDDQYNEYKTSSYTDYETDYDQATHLTTIDEQITVEEPVLKKYEKEEEALQETSQARKYRQLLHGRQSIRNAIILKEVLDRKYF